LPRNLVSTWLAASPTPLSNTNTPGLECLRVLIHRADPFPETVLAPWKRAGCSAHSISVTYAFAIAPCV
jgi:hypothetical protein